MPEVAERQPYKIVAETGSYEIMKFLDVHGKSSEENLLEYVEKTDLFDDQIKKRLFDLQRVGFIEIRYRNKNALISYILTAEGKEALSLVDVINGAPISSIFEASTFRDTSFTLITHDVTNYFIDELSCRRDFSEIFICSPWIRLMHNTLHDLSHILESARRTSEIDPRIHILTRAIPESVADSAKNPWNEQIRSTLLWFEQKGAEITYVPNLHTKLFIIYGKQFQTAIFGSENLTDAKNIELGIRITDPQIVNKLYIYWEDIYNSAISL
jgi:hypothetical protein